MESSAIEVSHGKTKQFTDHFFDLHQTCGKKRVKFNTNIGGIHANERGKRTVRNDFYKLDMSKLTGLQKLSLPDNVEI